MKLTFPRKEVEQLLQILRDAKMPVVQLVGDDGIYLVTSAASNKGKPFVVHSKQCNSSKMAFDEWWDAKRAIFGGDDGVEKIPLRDVEAALATYPPGRDLEFDMSPNSFAMISFVKKGVKS